MDQIFTALAETNVFQGLTAGEVTDLFGVARPSLARAIAILEEEGLLRAERKEITILDKEKLNKLLNY